MVLLNIAYLELDPSNPKNDYKYIKKDGKSLKNGNYPIVHLTFNELGKLLPDPSGWDKPASDSANKYDVLKYFNTFSNEFSYPGCPVGVLYTGRGLYLTLDWDFKVKQMDMRDPYLCNQVYNDLCTYSMYHHKRQHWFVINVTKEFVDYFKCVYHWIDFTSLLGKVLLISCIFVDNNDGNVQTLHLGTTFKSEYGTTDYSIMPYDGRECYVYVSDDGALVE